MGRGATACIGAVVCEPLFEGALQSVDILKYTYSLIYRYEIGSLCQRGYTVFYIYTTNITVIGIIAIWPRLSGVGGHVALVAQSTLLLSLGCNIYN